MRRFPLFSVVLLVGGTLGCAASQQMAARAPVQSSERFPAPYDKVWAATVGALADDGAPIQAIEKESGLITTQFVQFASGLNADKQLATIAYKPQGAGFLSIWSMGRYTLSLHVTKETDSTSVVKVTPHIEAYERNVTNAWHVCDSNGNLERRTFRTISAKL